MHSFLNFMLPFLKKIIIKLFYIASGIASSMKWNDTCDSALDLGLNGYLKTQHDYAVFCLEQPSCWVHACDV